MEVIPGIPVEFILSEQDGEEQIECTIPVTVTRIRVESSHVPYWLFEKTTTGKSVRKPISKYIYWHAIKEPVTLVIQKNTMHNSIRIVIDTTNK